VQDAGCKVKPLNNKYTLQHATCIPAPIICDNYHSIISVNRELFGNFENMIYATFNLSFL
jgi:hypothetical protein